MNIDANATTKEQIASILFDLGSPGELCTDGDDSEPVLPLLPILTSWSNDPGRYYGPIGIVLEREYTKGYFLEGMNVLEGHNLKAVKAIQSCNKRLTSDAKLRVLLADVENTVNECEWTERDGTWCWDWMFDDVGVNDVYNMKGEKTHCAFKFDHLELIDVTYKEHIDAEQIEWWGDAVNVHHDRVSRIRESLYKKHLIVIYPIKFENVKWH